MSLGIGENILKLLQEYNPWWRTGSVPTFYNKPLKRTAFKKVYGLMTSMTLKRHILLSGPRHAGKTTMIYQQINALLSSGIKPNQIFYISLDHPLLKLCTMDMLLSLAEGFLSPSDRAYLFIDEVQYIHGWKHTLNHFYKTKPNWQFLCSSSVLLNPDIEKEADANQLIIWSQIKLSTLSFYEYCQFSGYETPKTSFHSIHDLIEMDDESYNQLCNVLSPLYKAFSSYILAGGFPALIKYNEESNTQRLLSEDIIEKSLKSDIPSMYKIRHPELLDKVFLYICYHSGEIINIASMSRAIDNTPAVTLSNYIDYLQNANLITICDPVSLDGSTIQKPRSKIFVADSSIRNAILMLNRNDILVNQKEQHLTVQTMLCNHLTAYYQRSVSRVAYHKKLSEKGIDFVAESTTGRIIIDLRYITDSRLTGREPLNAVANSPEIQVSLAFLLTRNPDDYALHKAYNKKTVHRMPAHAFLYLLGLE